MSRSLGSRLATPLSPAVARKIGRAAVANRRSQAA